MAQHAALIGQKRDFLFRRECRSFRQVEMNAQGEAIPAFFIFGKRVASRVPVGKDADSGERSAVECFERSIRNGPRQTEIIRRDGKFPHTDHGRAPSFAKTVYLYTSSTFTYPAKISPVLGSASVFTMIVSTSPARSFSRTRVSLFHPFGVRY